MPVSWDVALYHPDAKDTKLFLAAYAQTMAVSVTVCETEAII
jgi:hypothetical protein